MVMDLIEKYIGEAKDYRMIFYNSNGKRVGEIEATAKSSTDAFNQAKMKKPSDAKMVDLVVNKRSIGKYDLSKKGLRDPVVHPGDLLATPRG